MDKSQAYKVLGLPEGASEEDVKNAYKKLAQQYNVEQYAAGPLREEAEKKMNELNEAFDALMSYIRTGTTSHASQAPTQSQPYYQGGAEGPSGKYPYIRQLINTGRVDEALAELNAIPNGSANAEWNFLMGSAYYYKGWLDQAMQFFSAAVRLDPTNREYQAALSNLRGSSNGDMQGNPYSNVDPATSAMSCACNTCSLMCCMDACCSMCR